MHQQSGAGGPTYLCVVNIISGETGSNLKLKRGGFQKGWSAKEGSTKRGSTKEGSIKNESTV